MGVAKTIESKLFSVAPEGKVRHSHHKVQFERLRLSMKRNVLVRKIVYQWYMLPSEDVESLFGLDALQGFQPSHIFGIYHPANHLLASEV